MGVAVGREQRLHLLAQARVLATLAREERSAVRLRPGKGRIKERKRVFQAVVSHLDGCQVGPGCIVGPFARLRPGTVLERDVHVGNFVEVKASTLGVGVKASHLTYLGDASVGAGTNIGAGVLTFSSGALGTTGSITFTGVSGGSGSGYTYSITGAGGTYFGKKIITHYLY